MRVPSGRWIDSTLSTSAPKNPSIWLVYGPAQNEVRSKTRIPRSGRSACPPQGLPVGPAPGAGRGPEEERWPQGWPTHRRHRIRAAAGVGGVAGVSGRAGRGPSAGDSRRPGWVTNAPRSTRCASRGVVAPSPSGADGTRRAAAVVMMSSTLWRVVHTAITADFGGAVDPDVDAADLGILRPLGPLDHGCETGELVGGERGESDPTVLCRLDGRRPRPPGTEEARPAPAGPRRPGSR